MDTIHITHVHLWLGVTVTAGSVLTLDLLARLLLELSLGGSCELIMAKPLVNDKAILLMAAN